jgi:hypothetical protein
MVLSRNFPGCFVPTSLLVWNPCPPGPPNRLHWLRVSRVGAAIATIYREIIALDREGRDCVGCVGMRDRPWGTRGARDSVGASVAIGRGRVDAMTTDRGVGVRDRVAGTTTRDWVGRCMRDRPRVGARGARDRL